MSYARFGWDGSDVYVFMHVGGWLECCTCILSHESWESFQAGDTKTMADHLKKHENAGHQVSRDIYDALWEDNKENFGKRTII